MRKFVTPNLWRHFDGVITDKLVEVGDTVQPGQPLLKFAHIKYLQGAGRRASQACAEPETEANGPSQAGWK